MKVILSIKPEYAEKIFSGEKKFEFRRAIFKNQTVQNVIVYASSPVQKVIGEFEIDKVLNLEKGLLWEETKAASGIDKKYYDAYFHDKDKGYAIKVKKVTKYDTPLELKRDYNIKVPPQSFMYFANN